MFNRVVDLAVQNRLLVLIALAVLIATAAFQIPKLNLDAFPDVTNVQVAVNTEAPGLAAEEVEQLITYPIEAVMYALPDVEEVRSISKTGLSGVTVVFKEGTDIYFARQLVFERLQAARELIPDGVGVPEMGPNTSGLGQVYQYLLIADPDSGYDAMELRSLHDWLVKLLLIPAEGVTEILSFGGEVRQYQVNLNPARMLSYDLSQNDVMEALENNNSNVGGWYMGRGQEQLVIRGMGWLGNGEQGLEQIRQVPVKTSDGITVTVNDVAEVALGTEIRQGAVTMTRKDEAGQVEQLGEVVSGIVLKRMGANTKATIDGIEARIDRINQALPSGVRFEPYYNQADLVTKAVETVTNALLLAFVFIAIVLALFLMNLRATTLVLLSIPISIGIALMIMAWFGLSANLMSLGGIAVAIGMLVDGSVVMVENMFKHLTHPDAKHDDHRDELAGDDPDPLDASHDDHGIAHRLQEAGREVARPIFFATAIILVVFMPLFSFEGVEAKLFQPMAISIMLAIVSAVVVALVVVPALASYMFRKGIRERESFILKPLEKLYRMGLAWSLKHSRVVVGAAAVLVVLAALVVPRLGTEFVPELE